MKEVRFRDPAGSVRTGEWQESSVRFGGENYETSKVDILPPVAPSKVVCMAANYSDHIEHDAPDDFDTPTRPEYFFKPPHTLAGHGDRITIPPEMDTVEYEGEVAAIIGEQCRRVSASDALDVVSGFTCLNDLSNRDDQLDEMNWVRGKAFDNAAPIGPCIAPTGKVPADARIQTQVNDEIKQESSRKYEIFSLETIIEDLTKYITLEEGDVISLGTPAGVDEVEDGDQIAIEIEGIGTLEHTIHRPSE
jgi:2-keto-4-pentenoate hydratase/2-oxohepta-3-ene-1,7-dioic acid hydratase in catechol pathway